MSPRIVHYSDVENAFDRPERIGRLVGTIERVRERGGESGGGSGEETHLTGDHEAGQEGYIASDVDWGICQRDRQNIYNNGYGLPSDPAPVAPFTAGGDGSSEDTKVVLRSVYMLFDADGNELTGRDGYPDRPESQSSFIVSVNNEAATTGFGGTDGEGDSDDGATVGV